MIENNYYKKRIIMWIMIFVLLVAGTISGCGKNTEIVLTTDFDRDEVFRIEQSSCYVPEIMVYLVNCENQYDEIFGSKIWQVPIEGVTMESKYKDTILARIAQIKVMNLMAADRGVELTDDDILRVKAATRDYYASLNEDEIELMDVDEDLIYDLYYEFALADKVYHEITDAVEPEISDDEARIITVREILIKTYKTVNNSTVSYNEAERQSAYNRIYNIKKRLDEGEDFDIIAEGNENEDSQIEYSFGRGVMPENYEKVAFDLPVGEISDIIETEYGYHIIKSMSTYDLEETDRNKEVILRKRKQEAFNEIYDNYVMTLNSNLNGDLWDEIGYTKTDEITTTNFFSIYDDYFVTITAQ